MSMLPPRISIAVPSFNQGAFIGETLQSLVDQQYPSLEVIIQDGGSTDGAVRVAQEFADRYPHTFRLFVEKDRGHAHAVNKAFRKSTGAILGYLNSDDTLYPGCLHSVAREIDPARGRYVVFGRCLFTGDGSPYVGREHPAEFHGHFDMLAVWRRGFNSIPQPSTFWHRKVYETLRGLRRALQSGPRLPAMVSGQPALRLPPGGRALVNLPDASGLGVVEQDGAGVARHHDPVQPDALGAVVAPPALAMRAVASLA